MAIAQYRLEKLVGEVKLVGRMFTSAVLHPANYPELNSIDELIGQVGLRLACSINTNGGIQDGQGFVYHESQVERVNYRWHLDDNYKDGSKVLLTSLYHGDRIDSNLNLYF